MLLLAIELLLAALIIAGVAVIFYPAAMILAGVMGLFVCERGAAAQTARDAWAARQDRKAAKGAQ